MKSISKITLASSIVFSSAVGLGLVNSDNTHIQAQAAETPYYNYTGYTSAGSGFVLDQDFINSIKYDNLTINGYKITKGTSEIGEKVVKYDQSFHVLGKNKADAVTFDLDGKTVSKEDLLKAYGQPIGMPSETPNGLVQKHKVGEKLVQFYMKNGYVTEVQINS